MVPKSTYSAFGLEWLKKKADELKKYVDSNPFDELRDRIEIVNGKEMLAATIEKQIASITQALKDYGAILEIIAKIEDRENKKIENIRGDEKIGVIAQKFAAKSNPLGDD